MGVTLGDVLDEISADAPAIARIIMARFRSESGDYEQLTDEELLPGIEQNVVGALEIASGEREMGEEERSQTEALSARRARQGVGVDSLMLAYRVGIEIAWNEFRGKAEAMGLPVEEQLAGSERLRHWADQHMAVIARAHRDAEIEIKRHDRDRATSFIQALTSGSIESARLRREALIHGLDPHREFAVARIRGEVDAWAVETRLDPDREGLVTHLDGDLVALLATEPQPIPGVITGVGSRVPLEAVPASFLSASRAVEVADALGRTGLVRLEDFGLLAEVVEQPEIGENLRRRYLEVVEDRGSFGADLTGTVRAWLREGRSIERTSSLLFIHRNTLRHRLRRFEELAECSLDDPQAIAELWWAFAFDDLA